MRIIFFLIFLLFLFQPIFAHESGASFERTIGAYTVDIGYQPESLHAGEEVIFDFGLHTADTDGDAPFDSVWVRIEQGKDTLLATGVVQPEIGPATLLLSLSPSVTDPLSLYTRFEKGGKALAEATFTLPVERTAPENKDLSAFSPLVLAAIAVLFVGAVFFFSRRKTAL